MFELWKLLSALKEVSQFSLLSWLCAQIDSHNGLETLNFSSFLYDIVQYK